MIGRHGNVFATALAYLQNEQTLLDVGTRRLEVWLYEMIVC